MKVSRNDPCPCGSGKKYKHCCLDKDTRAPETLAYRRFSRAFDKVVPLLVEHGVSIFGKAAPDLAMGEFLGWPEEGEPPDEAGIERAELLFWPWFVFNWEYSRIEDEKKLLDGPEETTIAELFLATGKVDSQSPEGRLISQVNRAQYSFLEVLAVQPGRSVTVRDLLIGSETTVEEHTGSQTMAPGDILFGRAVTVDGTGMFLGLSAFIIPPGIKPQIMQFRQFITRGGQEATPDLLYEFDLEIRQFFFQIDQVLFSPPQLENSDGDPLEFHRLIYDIASADEAVDQLASLCRSTPLKKLREAAAKDQDGRIVTAVFDWNRVPKKGTGKAMGATVLAHIEIEDRRMTISVNSAVRAAAVKTEIEKRLGAGAQLRLDEISQPGAMLGKSGALEPEAGLSEAEEQSWADPEIRQHLYEIIQAHWKEWVNERLPALGGATPRQAVRRRDGREAVEAMLRDAEKAAARDPVRLEIEGEIIADVRRRLGLGSTPGERGAGGETESVGQIKALAAAFGEHRLNETYTGFALTLCDAAAACAELNLNRGRTEIWAAAMVYAIAQLNFLFSVETPNHLSGDELCRWFGVKKTTVAQKAQKIRSALGLFHDDERFCAPQITRFFQFAEDEHGFIHPIADLSAENGLACPPLRAPETGPEAAAPAALEPVEQKPKPLRDGQLKLFED